jgi:hypothetical protein
MGSEDDTLPCKCVVVSPPLEAGFGTASLEGPSAARWLVLHALRAHRRATHYSSPLCYFIYGYAMLFHLHLSSPNFDWRLVTSPPSSTLAVLTPPPATNFAQNQHVLQLLRRKVHGHVAVVLGFLPLRLSQGVQVRAIRRAGRFAAPAPQATA